ncbi:Gimap6, partial [Symbiodinium sp. CCMP2456]
QDVPLDSSAMDPAADSAIGRSTCTQSPQAMISKAFVLGIVEYANWGRLEGAGADAKQANKFLGDMGHGEATTVLSGEVPQQILCQALTTWVRDIPQATHGQQRPVLIGFFSCHSMTKPNGFPLLLASDAPRKEDVSEAEAVPAIDIEEQLIAPINKIQLDGERWLRVILVFDCCLSPFHGALHDTWTSRGPSACPPSVHDFYFLFACDPGLEAAERPNGGALMKELMPRLRQQLPIEQIFNEVGAELARKSQGSRLRMSQRPWTMYRLSETGLVLAEPIVILLVGETGSGKSTLGNALLGKTSFKVSRSMVSETPGLQHADAKVGNQTLRVYDTQGFGDNRDGQVVGELFPASGGVDAILFVMRFGRFTQHDLELLAQFQKKTQTPPERMLLVFSQALEKADLSPELFRKEVELWSEQCVPLRAALTQVAGIMATECGSVPGQRKARDRVWEWMRRHAPAYNLKSKLHVAEVSTAGMAEDGLRKNISFPAIGVRGPAHRDALPKQHAVSQRLSPEDQRHLEQSGSKPADSCVRPGREHLFQGVTESFRAVGDAFADMDEVRQNVPARMFVSAWRTGVDVLSERHQNQAEPERKHKRATDYQYMRELKELVAMGFREGDAHGALEATGGNIEAAANRLLG